MKRGAWIAIGVAVGVAALSRASAQPNPDSTDPEQELLRQIAELRAEGGPAPANLVAPLQALALLYEENEDHSFAITTLEEARYVTRVNRGLTSADEALLLRQEIRNEKARGNHSRVWELERDMVTIARENLDDARMLPIFRELAEDRLAVIEEVRTGERPPLIYAGCYNAAPPAAYDYTRGASAAASPGRLTSPCIGGINQDIIYRLRGELLMYYADAIEIILRTGDYASEELRQLERAALRTAYRRRIWSQGESMAGRPVLQLSESGGSFRRCPAGTLDDYLALDILSSCLAPVGHFPGRIVIANVGNSEALIRLIAYEVRAAAPAPTRAKAVAELADELILRVPIDRRRLEPPTAALTLYERASGEMQSNMEAWTEAFAPELPIILPAYEPNPFALAATTSASRYIDASFTITRFGKSERIEILDTTSKAATHQEERDLVRLIENTSFRPRFVDGKIDADRVTVRYPLN